MQENESSSMPTPVVTGFSQESCSGQPIFLLSCARSGSTLLRIILDTHSNICSPGELGLGDLCRRLWAVSEYLSDSRVAVDTTQEQFIPAQVRRIVSSLMDPYAQTKNKSIWCEKTPSNLMHLDIIEKVFPDAKYICLYRHCMDVTYSMVEGSRFWIWPELVGYLFPKAMKNPQALNIAVAAIDNWVDANQRLIRHESQNPQKCFRIKYEDLVNQPVETLRPLCDFLEVEWEEQMVDSVFSTPHDYSGSGGDDKIVYSKQIDRKNVGKGSSIPLQVIPQDTLEKMNQMLGVLDYPKVGTDWGLSGLDFKNAGTVPQAVVADSTIAFQMKELLESFIPEQLRKHHKQTAKEGNRQLEGVCKLIIAGEPGGSWLIDLKKPEVIRQTANQRNDADCTILIAPGDLVAMIKGNLNPISARIEGKIRISGDIALAEKIGVLLFR